MTVDVRNLIFATEPRTKLAGPIDIPIDSAEVVSHSLRNSLTSEAREDGSNVVDHVITEADEITIQGLVSDFPVAILGGLVGGAAASGLLGDVLGLERPSRSAWELLKHAQRTHALMRVETSLGTLEDMIGVSLDSTQTAKTANALRFTWTLKKDQRVTTADTSLELVDVALGQVDLATPTADLGAQSLETPTSAESEAFSRALGGGA